MCWVAGGTVGSPISSWLTALVCIELLLSMCVSVKILDKRHIVKSKKAQYVKRERDLLSNLDHPFFVKLYFTFQDDEKLCILKQRSHAVSCGDDWKTSCSFQIVQVIKVPMTAFEQSWLQCINHINYILCVFTLTLFSDFGLSFAKNGELLKYIRKIGSFDETCTRFYSAEIVCALEYLHNKEIIHR